MALTMPEMQPQPDLAATHLQFCVRFYWRITASILSLATDCRYLQDVSKLKDVDTFPFRLCFWLPTPSKFNRRAPLFSISGVSIDSVALDKLHMIDLGLICRWISSSIWEILLSDGFLTKSGNKDTLLRVGLMHLRHKMFVWYKTNRQPKKSNQRDELQNITLGMLGEEKSPNFTQVKAAEARNLVKFVISILEETFEHLPENSAALLLGSGKALANFLDLLDKTKERHMNNQQLQEAFDTGARHLLLFHKYWGDAGLWPKHHLFTHLLRRMPAQGNCKYYQTYLDESLNGKIAAIAASCHMSTFGPLIFKKFDLLCQLVDLGENKPGVCLPCGQA